METLTCIKHHLTTLNTNDIFTSRQMLRFGPRKYVDLALSRLVREKRIKRLSYGVFCLMQESEASPTVHDVVAKKKGGNKVVLAELITDPVAPDCKLIYLTDGYSGSFLCNGTRVLLKKICDRKRQLSRSEIGRIFLALWLTGRRNVDAKLVHDSINRLSAIDKARLKSYLPLLPGWLQNYLIAELNQLGL
ncbi:MAG: hypothetical protein SFY67_11890 [Candidatus Melainabacteria bacterium]|nr:hypothetical protein [Candidatus Melainabacteria bacterium]